MIINIRQLSSNIKQEYLIDGDFSCRGKLGSFNRFQRITLSAQNQLLYAKYHFKNPINYIPLIDMLGFNKLSRVFHIYDSTGFCGEFLYTEHGFAEEVFHLHLRYAGDNEELLFRDYLTAHPQTAREYESLKVSLADKFSYDRDGYTEAKGGFIRSVTERAKREAGRK